MKEAIERCINTNTIEELEAELAQLNQERLSYLGSMGSASVRGRSTACYEQISFIEKVIEHYNVMS